MEHPDHNHASLDPIGDLDRILDAALEKYSSVEPRPGLEHRILANLRSEQAVIHIWRWAFAASAAAILIALAVGWRSMRPHSNVANHIVSNEPSPPADERRSPPPPSGPNHPAAIDGSRPTTVALRQKRHTYGNPKLDQFPSPRPMSQQEQLLTRYVAQFGDEAVMIARVQAEAMRIDREKEQQETESGGNQNLQAR